MKKILIANWKMKLFEKQSLDLTKKIKKKKFSKIEIVLAPSFPYLSAVKKLLAKTTIKLAAQNSAAQTLGALTGEVAAEMIKDIGCSYAIVGHSERRQNLFETDQLINEKIKRLFEQKITPILCVGETLEQKKNGRRNQVLVQQLKNCLSKIAVLEKENLVLAYEPVWAIGSGNVVDVAELEAVWGILKHAISMLVSENYFENNVRFIYGGSVDEKNIEQFSALPFVHGFLVGGASLSADKFLTMAEILNRS
jgi:triosephosphate isomerase (TIM)